MDRLTNLEVFGKVVETSSFTGAAEKLGLSRAAVSKHVMQLEERLDARLLNRTTRRVSTTEVGRAYYERAVRILHDLEEADLAASQLQDEPRGTLRVSAPMSFDPGRLGAFAADFLAQYPDLHLDLALNDRQIDLVEEGIDVALRIGELKDSSMIARRLAPFRRTLVASPGYLESHGTPETPDDLRHHNCVRYSFPGRPPGWRLTGPDGQRHEVDVSGRFYVNNAAVVAQAVIQNVGIGMLPTYLSGYHVKEGRLRPVLPRYRTSEVDIYAVYPPNRHLSAKVRVYIDYMVKRWSPRPDWDIAYDAGVVKYCGAECLEEEVAAE
ncbi:MAG: LysR family transcriptional regulator [Alphaproteobacteria bacterium]